MNNSNTKHSRKKRKRLIRVAEGYLELMTMFEDRWPVDPVLAPDLADRAISTLNQIASLKKNSNSQTRKRYRAHVCILKGQACRIAQRFESAIQFFEDALDLDEDNFDTLLAVAWCYKRTERLADAIASMHRAVEIEPESPVARYNLACYLAIAEEAQSSVQNLREAFQIDPNLRDNVEYESDFDLIRNDPEFIALISNLPNESEAI